MKVAPWAATAGGLLLHIRLTPKGGRDAIDGVERLADGRAVLKARVRAAPSDGDANASLISLIAGILDVAPRSVTLASGAGGRIKRLAIQGDAASLLEKLRQLIGPGSEE